MKKGWLLFLHLVVLSFPFLTNAQRVEQIVSFDSAIEIHKDSSMTATEKIRVISAGDQIRHGIYRDFPLAYRDRLGNRYLVGFDLQEVYKNGSPEPYHTERAGNGIRIYVGATDILIPYGTYEYVIRYKTTGQLGFFRDHDELYWNVTGSGWVFDIEQATATVKLPAEIPVAQITASLYTGPQGSTTQEGTWRVTEQGEIKFTTAKSLHPYEGLTIVVGWPKGIVDTPTAVENIGAAIYANADYIVGIAGLITVFLYYMYVWYTHGRDPKRGTIIAQYEPPQGFSPAFLRFIWRMKADHRAFAASIINLGVKGKLKITEERGFFKKTSYTFTKMNRQSVNFFAEENLLENEFFKTGIHTAVLMRKYGKTIGMTFCLTTYILTFADNKLTSSQFQ